MENENDLKPDNYELSQQTKKANSDKIFTGIFIGFLIGIATYSTFKYGLGFFTFAPLLFIYLLVRRRNKKLK